jgi:hypothetical protein
MTIHIDQGSETPFADAFCVTDKHCRQNRNFETLNRMFRCLRYRSVT